MNTKPSLWWLAALLFAVSSAGPVVNPRHWQYKSCFLGDPHAPCDLNALGAQGWELAAATPFTWSDGTASAQVFLKRETP